MTNFIQMVTAQRRNDAHMAVLKMPLETLQRKASAIMEHRSLIERMDQCRAKGQTCIIAEMKKASPSAGMLVNNYDPASLALSYEAGGAAALSVLTEPHYFMGSDDDLRKARNVSDLPILRKDFISDMYQLYETAVLGADIMLLIAAGLDFHVLRDLYIVGMAIGLEIIVEVHDLDELEMVLPLAKAIIGVNNRDLKTLETDLSVSKELAPYIPRDRPAISESGIHTRNDIDELEALGFRGFLIGESLLKAFNARLALNKLIHSQVRKQRL